MKNSNWKITVPNEADAHSIFTGHSQICWVLGGIGETKGEPCGSPLFKT